MNSSDFRAELAKIMPGYKWTVHMQPKYSSASQDHWPLVASGIQSSGSNRLSTLEVERRERDGSVAYTARSAGYGRRAKWLHAHTDSTLARALRGLQDHYEAMASKYSSHAGALKVGRKGAEQEGGAA